MSKYSLTTFLVSVIVTKLPFTVNVMRLGLALVQRTNFNTVKQANSSLSAAG